MLYFSKLRIIFISLISLIFIFFASSNLLKFSNEILNKKINLGLDLQGGSYLLLEIDNTPVIEQKIQNFTIYFLHLECWTFFQFYKILKMNLII